MKIRCLFGHKWRAVPWFKPRDFDRDWRRPEKMCMRCFKEWRTRVVLRITSAEGPGIGYYGPPYYEGQTPPEGYESWAVYRQEGIDKLLKRVKNSKVGKSRYE